MTVNTRNAKVTFGFVRGPIPMLMWLRDPQYNIDKGSTTIQARRNSNRKEAGECSRPRL